MWVLGFGVVFDKAGGKSLIEGSENEFYRDSMNDDATEPYIRSVLLTIRNHECHRSNQLVPRPLKDTLKFAQPERSAAASQSAFCHCHRLYLLRTCLSLFNLTLTLSVCCCSFYHYLYHSPSIEPALAWKHHCRGRSVPQRWSHHSTTTFLPETSLPQRGNSTVCLAGSIVRLDLDTADMVLTREGSSPRDPDKFPTAQLFLLGSSLRHFPLRHRH